MDRGAAAAWRGAVARAATEFLTVAQRKTALGTGEGRFTFAKQDA